MTVSTYDPAFHAAGTQFGIDPALLKAQAAVESGFDPKAVSPKGAIGLMQIMPETAKGLGVDPSDPAQAIYGAARLMRQNLDRYKGDLESAVAAYHGGYDQSQWGPLTHAYVGKVANAFQGVRQGGFVPADAFMPGPGPGQSAAPSQADLMLQVLSGKTAPAQPAPTGAAVAAQPGAAPSQAGLMLQVLSGGGAPNAPIAPSPASGVPGPAGAPAPVAAGPAVISQAPAPSPTGMDAMIGGSVDQSSLTSLAKGAKDVVDAGAQLAAHAMPGLATGVDNVARWLNRQPIIGPVTQAIGMTPTGPAGSSPPANIDQDIAASNTQYQADRAANGQTGADLFRFGGNVAATLPLAAATAPLAGGGVLGAAVAGGVNGALNGALTPVMDPNADFSNEKLRQTAVGAGAGALGGGVIAGAGRMIAPKTSDAIQTMLAKGVTPTPGQIAGGIPAAIESKLTSVPIVGDLIKNGQRRAVNDFNVAAYNEALAPIGAAYTGAPGRDGIAVVEGKLGEAYNALLPKLQFRADGPFVQGLTELQDLAQNMPAPQARQFINIVKNKVYARIAPSGAMDGLTLKGVQSELSRLAKGYGSSASFDERELGSAVDQLNEIVRSTVERSNPSLAPQLSAINQGWAIYARLRQAAASLGGEQGVFTPAQLLNAVKMGDRSVGKGAFAKGDALLQDFAEAGKTALGPNIPDSGTPGRAAMMGLGGLAAGVATGTVPIMPVLGGAAAASVPAAFYTPFGQKLAAALLAKRPQSLTGPLADTVRQSFPLGSTVAAQSSLRPN